MHNVKAAATIALVILGLAGPRTARAQRIPESFLARPTRRDSQPNAIELRALEQPVSRDRVASGQQLLFTGEEQRASAKAYIVTGALVGAGLATAGLYLYYRQNSDQDAVMSPFALVPVILGGAALGAVGGWVIHRAVKD